MLYDFKSLECVLIGQLFEKFANLLENFDLYFFFLSKTMCVIFLSPMKKNCMNSASVQVSIQFFQWIQKGFKKFKNLYLENGFFMFFFVYGKAVGIA